MTLLFTSGSVSGTSSETSLFDITLDEHFSTYIFTNAMTAGDVYVIRVYVKDQNASTMRTWGTFTLSGVQSDPAYFIPWLPTKEYKVTIQKTSGTDRSFGWLRQES